MRPVQCGLLIALVMALHPFAPHDAAARQAIPTERTAVSKNTVQFDRLPGYTAAQTRMANRIASRFAAAGYGKVHQIAAVSVAIRESTLNPKAFNRGCQCYGLFQLNRAAGLGRGHSVSSLVDPDTNIRLIIGEANRFKSFRNAGTVDTAVDSFVRHVTRPARKASVVRATIRTARMVEKAAVSRRMAAAH